MILAACLSALLVGQTADTVTTVRLLQRPGYAEGNPLLPHGPRGIVLVKASLTTAIVVTGWQMRHQHPKWAGAMFLVGGVSGSLAAWHNASITGKAPHGQKR